MFLSTLFFAINCRIPLFYSGESLRIKLSSINVPVLRHAQQNRHRRNAVPTQRPNQSVRRWNLQGRKAHQIISLTKVQRH